MSQDIINENQNISYTNLDFSSIYVEILDMIKNLSYKWDPSISNESDPGVILIKLAALIADKCNYNIDKSILEAFPLSVTQDGNARQLYEQLGYYMNWYESASVPVSLTWIGSKTDKLDSYTIPKFTPICDDEGNTVYTLIGVESEDGIAVSGITVNTNGEIQIARAMEGVALQYEYVTGESVITSQMIDPNHSNNRRLYFSTSAGEYVAQNGIFIKNTGQENYNEWARVDNLYEQDFNELRYTFGYDSLSNTCYIEFPDNYAELFGSGIEITYLVLDSQYNEVPVQTLTKFVSPFYTKEDPTLPMDNNSIKVFNTYKASGHRNKETINEAYDNYKKTVGTFSTLVTLRDYLNYIRDNDLNLCSNAFVCDRTNDVQTVYKIISKQNGLDTIVTKVEQLYDKTEIESSYNCTFFRTSDTSVTDNNKKYFAITNNNQIEYIEHPSGNPNEQHWYEMETPVIKTEDAMDAFSLKFYLLKKSISVDSKSAFNETFNMMTDSINLDSLLENKSHLEHLYRDILPFGKDLYKKSEDTTVKDKTYYLFNEGVYEIVSPSEGDSPAGNGWYEVDIEALLPHTVFYKNLYPIDIKISTYRDDLSDLEKDEIRANIISAFYKSLNSNQLEFGDSISIDYIAEISKSSDERIKSVTVRSINYTTFAIYYDEDLKQFKELTLDSDISLLHPAEYSDEDSILISRIKKDIVTKSILAGTTQLLIPDTTFNYHLNQDYINYISNVNGLASEVIIDMGTDSDESYQVIDGESTRKRTYTLKDNESLTLFRPKIEDSRQFLTGIHYEYVINKDIIPNESYQLGSGEYFILYAPITDEISGDTTGYTAYAYTSAIKTYNNDSTSSDNVQSAIIKPSFEIKAQKSTGNISSFARDVIKEYFDANRTEYEYVYDIYNTSYITQIKNNTNINSNVISGTDSISIESLTSLEILRSDNYKFFWVLNTSQMAMQNDNITYQLFGSYDPKTDSASVNSYTLRTGEYLYYTDDKQQNLAILGPGTTLVRNCGVDSSTDTDITNSIYFTEYTRFINTPGNKFTALQIESEGQLVISPAANGLYVVESAVDISPANPYAENAYYNDNGVYIRAEETEPVADTYYRVTFSRTTDTAFNSGTYYYYLTMNKESNWYYKNSDGNSVLDSFNPDNIDEEDTVFELQGDIYTYESKDCINPSTSGYYEALTYNDNYVVDSYSISKQETSSLKSNHLRFIQTEDDSTITRNIFKDTYKNIKIDDVSTYRDIDFSLINSSPSKLKLFDATYKPYYYNGNEVEDIYMFDNPHDKGWTESASSGTVTTDTSPQIISIIPTSEINLFDHMSNIGYTSAWEKFYFYRVNSENNIYSYSSVSDSTLCGRNAYSDGLLKELYNKVSTIISPDFISNTQSGNSIIANISGTWTNDISFCKPNRWAVRKFNSNASGEYIIRSAEQIASSNGIGEAHPYLDYTGTLASDSYFFVLASDFDNPSESRYSKTEEFISLDTDRKLQMLFTYAISRGSFNSLFGKCNVQLLYLPEYYKPIDAVRQTEKNYYLPRDYFIKTFNQINPWTCTSKSNDDLYDNPLGAVEQNQWATIQNNTSLTIIENDMSWSFSTGDQIIIESPATSEGVNYPVFSNTEVSLNLNEYKVAYKRKNMEKEYLPSLSVETYKWKGYSSLLLNTASKNGQKLEDNQSITIYTDDGDSIVYDNNDGVVKYFQLKYPVSNVAGNYINVSSYDIVNKDTVSNEIYVYSLYLDTEDYYSYMNDNYRTYLYFNRGEPHTEVELPVSCKLTGDFLLPINLKEDTIIKCKYILRDGHNLPLNLEPYNDLEPHNDNVPQGYAGINNYLKSYYDDSEEFYGNGLDFISFNVPNLVSDGNGNLFIKISMPSYLSGYIDMTPKELYWYEQQENGSFALSNKTSKGSDLLIEVEHPADDTGISPKENKWLEEDGSTAFGFKLTDDEEWVTNNKNYYRERDFYLPVDKKFDELISNDIESVLLFNITGDEGKEVTYILEDVFKYNNNEIFGNDFNIVRNKIRQLDTDKEYNYSFIPSSNDIISNPLLPESFWNKNHVCNKFTIAQMNLEESFSGRSINNQIEF